MVIPLVYKTRKALKDKRRFNEFTKIQNTYFRRRSEKSKRIRPKSNNILSVDKERIIIPQIFDISQDLNAVLSIIYKTKKLVEKSRYRLFDFDMSNVKRIDDGAATILLSVCYDIDKKGKKVRVSWPTDPDAKKFIEQIGFRKFFAGFIHTKDSLNETLKKGKAKILQRETVPVIHKAMKTVFGVDSKNQRLQGMLIELMTNSVNHAYLANDREKSWYLSTRHEIKSNKVEFCFVDNGDGIINTINVRLGKRLLLTSEDLLKRAFAGEFRSRTKLTNRGRGLIVIQKNFANKTISGLKVITNNVILDFETGVAIKLNTPFSGTFYSWVLDKTCN